MLLIGKLAMGLAGTALVAGAILSSEGFIDVRVHQTDPKGTHISLMVPAMLVPATLRFIPRQNLQNAGDQVKPWLPLLDAATSGLAECPDGTLVEVTDPSEHVVVAKSGGSIVVDVVDPDENVHVSVPLAAVRSAIDEIAADAGTRPD